MYQSISGGGRDTVGLTGGAFEAVVAELEGLLASIPVSVITGRSEVVTKAPAPGSGVER